MAGAIAAIPGFGVSLALAADALAVSIVDAEPVATCLALIVIAGMMIVATATDADGHDDRIHFFPFFFAGVVSSFSFAAAAAVISLVIFATLTP